MPEQSTTDDVVFNPPSTSTPTVTMWLSTINLEESPTTPAHGPGTSGVSTTPDSPTNRLADRLRPSAEPTEVQNHVNIGRERRTPDITFFVTRQGDLIVNLPFVVVEIKPVARETDVSRSACIRALTQACEQAQFVFEKARDRVEDLHLLVLVSETFMYGGSVIPQDFLNDPLPNSPIGKDAKARRDKLQANVDAIVAKEIPIYNIWADADRTQFTPQFLEMYQTIFKGVKTQYGKVRS